ncbi:bifunctional adenosylcobinamide kinase/adenosylcobinamide-phosphate guanylyltransferase [Longispora albida]|uniref:bifunctional adenosylcobinamide kinase/adenosylcobinamide-phosphate guanylyltransferase n=1 Tax=Longispora albida TaxID=203523 RepID=UPI00146D6D77|nr:bifunctional adenosylcobinamide kinase/adenosylcobinamide-phosphate guanylyltransferase [Longispora albida]
MTEAYGRVLVLGGIRSGKSEYAESLLSGAPAVTYLATGPSADDDAWAERIKAHAERRPAHWTTRETTDLAAELDSPAPLLVDDLGSWLTAAFDAVRWEQAPELGALVDAVAARRGPLVMVSPEVGLAVVPATESGRRFADALGTLNRRLAEVCDGVVLVVAGAPIWLKGTPPSASDLTRRIRTAPERTSARPGVLVTGTELGELPDPFDPLTLPLPDEEAREAARARLSTLDVSGAGLGRMAGQVALAAALQGTPTPSEFTDVRLVLLNSAADPKPARGEGAFPLLADRAGVRVEVAVMAADDVDPAKEDVLTAEQVEAAIDHGRTLATRAADSGADLLILGSTSDNGQAAAAVTALLTGAEPAALLATVALADGSVDDNAWMDRAAGVRDTLRRVRAGARDPRTLLAAFGGSELAVATGLVLGATARRTPVLIDGPLGVAAGLLARDIAGQTRHWLLLLDHGGHPTVKLAADVLGVYPVLDLKLGLGEGANALAALPMLQSSLSLAANLCTG